VGLPLTTISECVPNSREQQDLEVAPARQDFAANYFQGPWKVGMK
jgi:hypothetical protein